MASTGKPEPQCPDWSFGQWLAVGSACVGGCLGGAGLCFAVCCGLLGLYASCLPRRPEVNDALTDVPAMLCGLCLSLPLSFLAGFGSALWTTSQVRKLWAGKHAKPTSMPPHLNKNEHPGTG